MNWWMWIVLGLALLGLELAMPGGFFLVFFGLAALLIGACVGVVADIPVWIQWISFSVLSIGLLLSFRQRIIQALGAKPAVDVDSLVGEDVEVREDIVPGGQGGVVLRGAPWKGVNAGTEPLVAGSRAKVIALDGLMLKIVAV